MKENGENGKKVENREQTESKIFFMFYAKYMFNI